MSHIIVFLIQFGFSLIVYSLLAYWYLCPWIAKLPIRTAMQILLVPHAFHHVGLVTRVSKVVGPDMPEEFSWGIAIGDSLLLIVAMISLAALRRRSPRAVLFLWIFTILGLLHNSSAGLQSIKAPQVIVANLGPHWYIGVFYVPLLLVSHVLIVYYLIRRKTELRSSGFWPNRSRGLKSRPA